jgi:hypothetical protein
MERFLQTLGRNTENSFERLAESGIGIVPNGFCHPEQFLILIA